MIYNYIKTVKTVFHSFENFAFLQAHLRNCCGTVVVFIIYRSPGYVVLGYVNEFESLFLQAQNYSMQSFTSDI